MKNRWSLSSGEQRVLGSRGAHALLLLWTTFMSGIPSSPRGSTRTTDTLRFCSKSSAVISALISFSHSQTVGGWGQFVATKIYFTSPLHPREWCPDLDAPDSFKQLERRLTRVIDLNGLAEEERAKRACLMLESGEGFVNVAEEEPQLTTKIVDLPLVQSPPRRSAYTSTLHLASPVASPTAAVSPLIAPHITDGFVKSIPPNTENSMQYGHDENDNNNMSNETKRETNYSINNNNNKR